MNAHHPVHGFFVMLGLLSGCGFILGGGRSSGDSSGSSEGGGGGFSGGGAYGRW